MKSCTLTVRPMLSITAMMQYGTNRVSGAMWVGLRYDRSAPTTIQIDMYFAMKPIAVSVLPPAWGRALERIAPYSTYILLAVVFILPLVGVNVLSAVLTPPLNNLMHLLTGL